MRSIDVKIIFEMLGVSYETDDLKEKLGIPSNGAIYHKILQNQDTRHEFDITNDFLMNARIDLKKDFGEIKDFKFINYGDTQLVYVMTTENERFAILVGQPSVDRGSVLEEYNNLRLLSLKNPEFVVTPSKYLSTSSRELYVAPYIYQARCIASQETGWGVYVPEPYYHFKLYTKEEQFNINSCMIALLIKLFDAENNLGIASCKIGGGDFILEKEWETEPLNQDNTLNRMKLIAARKLLKLELQEYITLIKKEFPKSTYYSSENERDSSILINCKSRIPMSDEEIQCGIQLGLKLKKNKFLC